MKERWKRFEQANRKEWGKIRDLFAIEMFVFDVLGWIFYPLYTYLTRRL